ncbi:tRNA epoxyqueuosine(34) reductase QueG [Clostridium cadaveris]|uniref:tRNA epoxyqueuosine(34) reductase QueG n=1 Tax=Clostridium cadaveris TaxID=1529 RepID=A0A316LZH6_9CLOT|nr:tRNA epoxyqueuosine(34) reductase QueG [Clostridium cadaveris]NME65137.1 tRNA epoxyqueuosine(34) reductase QueG [Clostridium cadaveris]PWL51331.1 MAG: tRNA epoxyqueuosine(34) reductase QueG [Clostridium cadaveris]
MTFKNEVVNYSKGLGLDAVGFTYCRRFNELEDFLKERKERKIENEFEEPDIEKRINPKLYMGDGKTIISIAFPYYGGDSQREDVYFSYYTMGMDYHKVVESYLKKICDFIKEKFCGKAEYFVDSNALPERYIAYLSGLGFIGRNGMLITEKYGSYVFLGEIITDIEVEDLKNNKREVQELLKFKNCGQCKKCLSNCPTSAINYNKTIPNICMSYITQSKVIEKPFINKMDGRIFGCDHCQICCPYNENIATDYLKEFEPMDYMKKADIEEIIYMDNKTFREKYGTTSCGWRGKATLQRNALIAKILKKQEFDIDEEKITSPKVQEYYEILKKL